MEPHRTDLDALPAGLLAAGGELEVPPCSALTAPRRVVLWGLIALVLPAVLGLTPGRAHQSEPSVSAGVFSAPAPVAFLVRHGEAEPTGQPDRPLAAAGQRRAELLAELLAYEGIVRVLSSDYPRSRQTAAPLAARLGLEVELYDPGDLEGLAAALRASPDRVLVVGHSNTTGELAALLGGDSGGPIAEEEHDRLYLVDLATGATRMRRYGEPGVSGGARDPEG